MISSYAKTLGDEDHVTRLDTEEDARGGGTR
jgi:hypothetical protein